MSEKKLSGAKKIILELLWSMEWVQGSEVFKAVQQTYYDRRIRELRESGWQIETSGNKYRLISQEKLPGNERKYPSAEQKREIFKRDKGTCQICGETDSRLLQYDHKIPQDRFGKTDTENLQLLCSTCNVIKRGACKRCKLTSCNGCPYAYPENLGGRLVLLLDKNLMEAIKAESIEFGLPESVLIAKYLKKHYGL